MSLLHPISPSLELTAESKTQKRLDNLRVLIEEVEKHPIPEDVAVLINQEIDTLNNSTDSEKQFRKALRRCQRQILDIVVRKLKRTPKNYHRNMWIGMGLAVFGVPLGVSFGVSMKNMGLIGVGIPIGMAIGVGVGTAMDKKAKEQGRQLNVEMEY